MKYLRNAWYVAAWDDELKPGDMLHRTLLNEPILLLRDNNGMAHALHDRCPHRFAPLHLGSYDGHALQCRYHGLKFDGDGACIHSPQGALPKAHAKSYPLIERHSMLWIWLGDADKVDAMLIPDFGYQDPDRAFVGKDYLHVNSNYLLEIDNILDLSHIEFLHPTTLGSGGVSAGQYVASKEGNQVWSKRLTDNEIMTDELSVAMGVAPGSPVDRWIHVRWDAPANMAIFAGAVAHGRPHNEGRETPTTHCFTPETDATTHYWFSICFPKILGDPGAIMASEQIKFLRVPFEQEDLPMLEAQQRRVGEAGFWSLKPIVLPGDAGGIRARRTLSRLIEQEQTDAAV
jgi:phenylpropionate dioxygenase-like ring-hydroxylating dioxygenase large terminal subunit